MAPQGEAAHARNGARAIPVTASAAVDNPDAAVSQLASVIGPAEPALVLLFASPGSALPALTARLRLALPSGCRVVGCSSAGELSSDGYRSGTVVAVGFPARSFRAGVVVLRDISRLPVSDWMSEVRAFHAGFAPRLDHSTFGVLLVDGLSKREDVLVATLDAAMPQTPVLGGSAGDGLEFSETCLVLDGEALTDAGLLCLIETDLAVHDVIFDHFQATATRMVVTRAEPDERLILEINAEPAAEEYARLVGVRREDLSPLVFAEHPLLVRMGGRYYVRAIREQTPEGGLRLMSAIETGMVMTLGRADDLTEGFEQMLAGLPAHPALVLSFDCILRRLAVEHAGLGTEIRDIFTRYNMVGFNTYGEQHNGMHMNQTFVGLAFLTPEPA